MLRQNTFTRGQKSNQTLTVFTEVPMLPMLSRSYTLLYVLFPVLFLTKIIVNEGPARTTPRADRRARLSNAERLKRGLTT